MTSECITLRNKPRMRVVGKEMNGQNAVRAYRNDPEGITLQIRMDTRFANAYLLFDEARELIDLLQKAVAS